MNLIVYLSGEIHSNWRDKLITESKKLSLPVIFIGPVTDHDLSDDCGEIILGKEKNKFWHDHKSAKINSIRTKNAIKKSDIVVVRFGDKYKQWNAAFEAGFASALSKSLIIMHDDNISHALKEVDASAMAVTQNIDEILKILQYTVNGKINN